MTGDSQSNDLFYKPHLSSSIGLRNLLVQRLTRSAKLRSDPDTQPFSLDNSQSRYQPTQKKILQATPRPDQRPSPIPLASWLLAACRLPPRHQNHEQQNHKLRTEMDDVPYRHRRSTISFVKFHGRSLYQVRCFVRACTKRRFCSTSSETINRTKVAALAATVAVTGIANTTIRLNTPPKARITGTKRNRSATFEQTKTTIPIVHPASRSAARSSPEHQNRLPRKADPAIHLNSVVSIGALT